MGLDMYLTKRTHVKTVGLIKPEELPEITGNVTGEETDIRPERISRVVEEVGYWRKANAIHNWFVENVQNGIDECQDSHVSREKLAELLGLVNEVLADRNKA